MAHLRNLVRSRGLWGNERKVLSLVLHSPSHHLLRRQFNGIFVQRASSVVVCSRRNFHSAATSAYIAREEEKEDDSIDSLDPWEQIGHSVDPSHGQSFDGGNEFQSVQKESLDNIFPHAGVLHAGGCGEEILEGLRGVNTKALLEKQIEIENTRRKVSVEKLLDSLKFPSQQAVESSNYVEKEVKEEQILGKVARGKSFFKDSVLSQAFSLSMQDDSNDIAGITDQYKAWIRSLSNAVDTRKNSLKLKETLVGLDNWYTPVLLLVPSQFIAAVVLHEVLGYFSQPGTLGVPVTGFALKVGETLYDEFQSRYDDGRTLNETDEATRSRLRLHTYFEKNSPALTAQNRAIYNASNPANWDVSKFLQLGALAIELMCRSCFVQPKYKGLTPTEQFEKQQANSTVPAFFFAHGMSKMKKYGMIMMHKGLALSIGSATSVEQLGRLHEVHLRPMVVPPKDWTTPYNGGYIHTRSGLLRDGAGAWERYEALRTMTSQLVFDALNKLGSTAWSLNSEVYELAKRVKRDDLGVTGLPVLSEKNLAELQTVISMKVPKLPKGRQATSEEYTQYREIIYRKEKARRTLQQWTSKHMDFQAKLDLAEFCKDYEQFWFPYSLDFRGRAYPIPPVSHMGDDLSRSFLRFSIGRKLGERGLYWLKVHFANQMGFDKASMDERCKWTEDRLDIVMRACKSPLNKDDPTIAEEWAKSESPWQTYACAVEIAKALSHPEGPENYVSHLPVHQDGSCNGLQHYAALGRDREGGEMVSLVQADRPGDVYTSVANAVRESVNEQASLYNGKAKSYSECTKSEQVPYMANKVKNMINRKLVKQTTMTKVYGVTMIGAREQIEKRLLEMNQKNQLELDRGGTIVGEILPDDEIFPISMYLAKETMRCIGATFRSAEEIQNWLNELASICSRLGQPLAWVTPLGFPIVQTYRDRKLRHVRTSLQSINILDYDGDGPVTKRKQVNAFPPNFIHSIDSTHMMLTARQCYDEGITFAAVHDSFWTHACDVDRMNTILRDEFIKLHRNSLLMDFREQFLLRFPQLSEDMVPLPPFQNTLDLEEIRNSTYFFS